MSITSAYGSDPEQYGILSLPMELGPHPVVVLVHGGFWRAEYRLHLMDPLAASLTARGFAVWNLEYRGVGHDGGGYPGTLEDVAAGLDHLMALADEHDLDLGRLAVVGHSAGGHLALWCGSRRMLQPGQPGAQPAIVPTLTIGLAAVADLAAAAADGLGNHAVREFLGGEPDAAADVYAIAQPDLSAQRVVLIHGDADDVVPVDQSTRFAGKAPVIVLHGEDHFDVIRPTQGAWAAALSVLEELRLH